MIAQHRSTFTHCATSRTVPWLRPGTDWVTSLTRIHAWFPVSKPSSVVPVTIPDRLSSYWNNRGGGVRRPKGERRASTWFSLFVAAPDRHLSVGSWSMAIWNGAAFFTSDRMSWLPRVKLEFRSIVGTILLKTNRRLETKLRVEPRDKWQHTIFSRAT